MKKNFGNFTMEEVRQVLKWLTSLDTASLLNVYYDDSEVVSWSAVGGWTEINTYKLANNRTVGITVVFETVTPYALSDLYTATKTITATDNKLTINIDNKVEADVTLTAEFKEGEWVVSGENSSGVVVSYKGDTTVDSGFTLAFNDIKNNQNADKSTLVTVTYDVILDTDAAIGLPGQENKVDLTYSNNPNNSGEGFNITNDTGKTPEDKVIVYTYALDITKEFQKADGSTANTPSDVDNITFSVAPKDKAALTFEKDTDGYYYPSANGISNLPLTDNKILIKGLDDGTYTITENGGAAGFNIAAAKDVTISAETVNNQKWNGSPASGLTKFDGAVVTDESTCSKNATVINIQGTTLPGTGGIGTTIFYLGGGAMAAIGGIYLISKRRMRKSEE
jgi:LPXTG-motif cell wall-anchored protein